MAEQDPKQVEKTLVDDVIEEGALENETGSMEASIAPNYDIEGGFNDPAVAKAINEAGDDRIEEVVTVGTDANGEQFTQISERVVGQE